MELGIGFGMIIALITGFLLDLFYQSLGIHAASAVLMMFIKPYWQHLNTPRSGYEVNTLPLIGNYGLNWYIGYAGPLILIYCLSVLFIEASNSNLFWLTLVKACSSALITLLFIVIIQYLFYRRAKQ